MSLTGRAPYQKGSKAAKTPKPMRQVSKKKAKQKATEKAEGAWQHMERVKELGCMACHRPGPSSAHHVTGDDKPRSDWRVIPLCYDCHQGPQGYHLAKRSWVARYGPDYKMLPALGDILGYPLE